MRYTHQNVTRLNHKSTVNENKSILKLNHNSTHIIHPTLFFVFVGITFTTDASMQASVCIPVNDNVHLSCRLYHSCYCSTIKISKVCGDERWEQLRLHGQHAMTCCCFFLESWVDLLLWGISWVTDWFVVIFRDKQKTKLADVGASRLTPRETFNIRTWAIHNTSDVWVVLFRDVPACVVVILHVHLHTGVINQLHCMLG